jgi:RNA polymerase sigma factor (sigma-70 family)
MGATRRLEAFVRTLRYSTLLGDGAARKDEELLDRYILERDEAAFEALVHRRGPMVWRVCWYWLRNAADAADAFQATFLVLVRRADSISPRALVGCWLYGVARNTALKVKTSNARRRAKEWAAGESRAPSGAEEERHQLKDMLDEELSPLPDKYRAPLVLCYLKGRTVRDAAGRLGWPQGTVAGRLARARGLLAKCLARRGLVMSAAEMTAAFARGGPSGVPPSLVAAAVKSATAVATNSTSAKVAALTARVVRDMPMCKVKRTATAVLLLVVGGGALAYGLAGGALPTARAEPGAGAAPAGEGPLTPPGQAGTLEGQKKAQARAAAQAYEAVKEHYQAGAVDEERVYQWSLRWLKAQQETSPGPASTVAAREAHLERMKELVTLAKNRASRSPEGGRGGEVVVRGMLVRDAGSASAEYYRAEAELWLAEAKDKAGTGR